MTVDDGRRLATVVLAVLVAVAVPAGAVPGAAAGGTAATAGATPLAATATATDDATSGNDSTPSPAPLANTTAPDGTSPANLSEDVRVSADAAANASVVLAAAANDSFAVDVDVAGSERSNVTTYVAEPALVDATTEANATGVTNVTADVDGAPASVVETTTNATNATNAITWYGLVVSNASNATVAFDVEGVAPGTNDADENVTVIEPLPAGVVRPNETAAVGGVDRVDPVDFSGKSRVGADYADNTTVTVETNVDTNFTADVTVPDAALEANDSGANASLYLRYDLTAGSANVSNVTVLVDNETVAFGVVEAALDDENESNTWLAVALANDSATVTVESPEGTLAPPERSAPEDEGGTPGPRERLPEEFAAFTETTPATPASGATLEGGIAPGMVRIEDGHAADATIALVNNDASNTTLDIEVTGNATNVTFYLNARAIAASQNVEGLVATVNTTNGTTEIPFAEAANARGAWIAIEIDHFSERRVTLKTQSNVSGPLPGSGTGKAPRNLDRDPFHEDVDGDGDQDFLDTVSLLFANESAVNDLPAKELAAADQNGDGEFGFMDVVGSLFE